MKTVTKEELRARVGYNDETVDALRDISGQRRRRNSSASRSPGRLVPASRPTLNDAMVFGYYGTSSYSSFNNINYTNFLTAVNAIPPKPGDGHTLVGWVAQRLHPILVRRVRSMRWRTTPCPSRGPCNTNSSSVTGRILCFRNARFLPFGLTFDRYVTEDTFLKLPSAEKPAVLLHAVVLFETERRGKTRTCAGKSFRS